MRQHRVTGTDHPSPRVLGALLFGAVAAVYANSLTGPLVFDDVSAVTENPSIRHGWALWHALAPPAGGLTISGRPVANLSLSLNYLISGEAVWSYHVLNVLIHATAALGLFGLVRRTLGATGPAWGIALLWAVHPLQTESVTYIAQRVESLEALCLLMTLYCLVRSEQANQPPNLRLRSLSVVFCALGMATKESMAVAPVIVLLYDRTFLAGGFRAALNQRGRYYAALAATWVILAALLIANGGNRGGTVGLGAGVTLWAYWLTQFPAIVHYLRLAVWPSPLIFEYGKFWEPGLGAVWPQATLVGALLAATAWALVRRPRWGFLGAMFFLLLAPTSLPPGTKQMIVEHRMYLPLAVVIVALGAMGWGATSAARLASHRVRARTTTVPSAPGGRAPPFYLAFAIPLALATIHRNRLYRSELSLWQDTVATRPTNSVAHCNYGVALFESGQSAAAIAQYQFALALDPTNVEAEYDLANALAQTGRVSEAIARFQSALAKQPADAKARCNYGNTLFLAGRAEEALEQFGLALNLDPTSARAHNDLGYALAGLGRLAAAVAEYDRAAELRPTDAQIAYNRGAALAQAGRLGDAEAEDRRAIRLQPNYPEAHNNLAALLARSERLNAAVSELNEAIRLSPGYWQARFNRAMALFQLGRPAEARQDLQQVLVANPGFRPAVDALSADSHL